MSNKLACLLFAVLLIAGCGGGGSSTNVPVNSGPYEAVAGRNWTIPFAAEGYKCSATLVTQDMDITAFSLTAADGLVEGGLYSSDSYSGTIGDFDCNAGTVGTHLLHAFGAGTGPVVFPDGVAMHVSQGQYLILNLHLINLLNQPASGTVTLAASKLLPGIVVLHQAEAFMAGTININIPTDNVLHTATGSCLVGNNSLHIMALTPLMRSFGVHARFDVQGNRNNIPFSNNLVDHDFAPGQQVSYPITPITNLVQGDTLKTVCSYINNGSSTAIFGDSTATETCFVAVYGYTDDNSTMTPPYDCAYGHAIQ